MPVGRFTGVLDLLMNCHDVRERFSTPSRGGGLGLTERALAHAHVAQCADCQAERASRRLEVSSPPGAEPSHRAAISTAVAYLSERARFAITRVAPSLIRLRSSCLSACRGATRAGSEAAGAVLGSLSRLRTLVSISPTVSRRAVVAVIEAASALLTRVSRLLRALFMPTARAAAGLAGLARSGSARIPRRLIRLGSAARIVCHPVARAASEAAGAGAARVLALRSRLRVPVSRSFRVPVGAAGRVLAAARGGAARILGLSFRIGGRVSSLRAPSARAVGRIVATIPAGARAHPKLCTGIVGLLILVPSILLLGPRRWPEQLVPRFSPGERLSRPGERLLPEVRRPVDRKAAEPVAAAPVSGPRPAPTPRATVAEAHAVPALVRGFTPALAESRTTASAPPPSTETTRDAPRDAEVPDPTAAIDWLLQGSGRRHAERP